MKRQIRVGVFETNSSSVHSLTMCLKEDYEKWCSGNLYFYIGSQYGFPDEKCPEKGKIYTKEEAIEFCKERYKKMNPERNFEDRVDLKEKDEVIDYLREMDFIDYAYDNEYLEWYEGEFTTPSGETVVAFGEYGMDG